MTVVLHDAAPRRTYHFFLNLGYQAMITRPCAEIRNIDLQLRQIHYRPGRRLHTLREIDGLIEKLPQKAVLIRMDFSDLYRNVVHDSTLLIGCRITVFSRSGLHRRTSLK